MVSTRQSSNMGGGSGVSAGEGLCEPGPSRRHSSQVQSGVVHPASTSGTQPQSRVLAQQDMTMEISDKSSSNLNSSTATHVRPVSHSSQVQSGVVIPAATSASQPPSRVLTLQDMPMEIMDKICSNLNYNTVAHMRPVSRTMDRICGSILNSSFQKLQAQMLSRFQAIKAQMPRRESARRNHPLACESDIIETLHMRLTLLQMSFGKHIERKHCCFFPGEILDEVNRILHYIKITPKLARPFKVTDELFDLSTMAMEYFKERIEPKLPEIPYFGTDFLDLAGTFSSSSSVNKPFVCIDSSPMSLSGGKSGSANDDGASPPHMSDDQALLDVNMPSPQSNIAVRRRLRRIKQGMKKYNTQLMVLRRDLRGCRTKIAEQQKQIVEYANRLDDHDKKNEETSRKFSTLLQELNKCKTELQYWRSKSPAIPVCGGCGLSIPVPTDANQGVMPESFGEALNFIPIGGAESPTENVTPGGVNKQESGVTSVKQDLIATGAKQEAAAAGAAGVKQESLPMIMAPPKAPVPSVSSKRKASSEEQQQQTQQQSNDAAKKPRRTAKSRQAKRSKI